MRYLNSWLTSFSILLISPQNSILLLHRVTTSTAFASAHVFPGGHISPQDGYLPPVDDFWRHEDSEAYRLGAIRECFEESGILLAKDKTQRLLSLSDEERERGRHAIHNKKIPFHVWLQTVGGKADLDRLIPFTRWLTPTSVPRRRYSTQMYIYFLPLDSQTNIPNTVHVPTPDGGIEHTTAEFLPVSEWLSRYRADDIILYAPQFFLLSIIAPFLDPVPDVGDQSTLQAQREKLVDFCKLREDGEPLWAEKCISPHPIWKNRKRIFMGLDQPGPEVAGAGRRGDGKRVITWIFRDGRQQNLELRWRQDVLKERERRQASEVQESSKEEMETELLKGETIAKERL